MNLGSSGVYDALFKQMDFLSIMAVLQLMPELRKYAKPYINSTYVVKRMCKKFNLRYDDLVSRMTPLNPNSGSILFGGMVTNIILGDLPPKMNESSDFDIIHYTYRDNLYYPLENDLEIMNGLSNTLHSIYPLLHRNEGPPSFVDPDPYPVTFIKKDGTAADNRSYDHNTLGYTIDSLEDYITDMCDLSITQVFYDPKRPEFFIKDINEFFTKRFTVNLNDIAYKEYIKFKKLYPMVKITPDILGTPSVSPIFNESRLRVRIQKYIDKGIAVKIEVDRNPVDKYGLFSSDPYYMKSIFKKIEDNFRKDDINNIIALGTPAFLYKDSVRYAMIVHDYYDNYLRNFNLRPSNYMISKTLNDIKGMTKTNVNLKLDSMEMSLNNPDHIYIPYQNIPCEDDITQQYTQCHNVYYHYFEYLADVYHINTVQRPDTTYIINKNKNTILTKSGERIDYLQHVMYDYLEYRQKADKTSISIEKKYSHVPVYILNYICQSKYPWSVSDW